MNEPKARPLRTLPLKSRPLTTHSVAWSCDAELATTTGDTISIFLPEYTLASQRDHSARTQGGLQHQFSLSLQTLGIIKSEPVINAALLASEGISPPEPRDETKPLFLPGVGRGSIAKNGAALHQVVALQWSPSGLGTNLRPVLAALTTSGAVVALGELVDGCPGTTSGDRSRNFKHWKVLWGVGACLPVPDIKSEHGFREVDERIKSFAWAGEIGPGKALLAYATDDEQIVIMTLQRISRVMEQTRWKLQELLRFDGKGCHLPVDPMDPDYVPCGSGFSLKWSPWVVQGTQRSATLAYLARNYVGFRRITLPDGWFADGPPTVAVETADTASICLSLAADAFVEWEDAIWDEEGVQTARGFIATPWVALPFKVALSGPLSDSRNTHTIWECATAYPTGTHIHTNPITGLIIHSPGVGPKLPVPYYSLVRLAATPGRFDWHETNHPCDPEELPQWAQDIERQLILVAPRVSVMMGVDSDSEDEYDEASTKDLGPIVSPFSFRIWGIAMSPGGCSTVVLATKSSTMHRDRNGDSRLLFSWDSTPDDGEDIAAAQESGRTGLTTEGRMWMWMYGNGSNPLHAVTRRSGFLESAFKDNFRAVVETQKCVFCNTELEFAESEATCRNGHPFVVCANTGLAIMEPGISRICGVCGTRCLQPSQMIKVAKEEMGRDVSIESADDACARCGGKFVA